MDNDEFDLDAHFSEERADDGQIQAITSNERTTCTAINCTVTCYFTCGGISGRPCAC